MAREEYPVAIVGAGPGGIAAAIQLRRYGIEYVWFEREEPGGLLRNANSVENYPGFPGGIAGLDLVSRFRAQMDSAGVAPIREEVVSLDLRGDAFRLATPSRTVTAQRAVVASGTRARGLPQLADSGDLGERLSGEIHQLRSLAGSEIAIVGAGDAAFDYALTLAAGNRVTVLNRGDRVKCLPLLWERCAAAPNIEYRGGVEVTGARRSGERVALRCRQHGSGKESDLLVDYLVAAIGRRPALDFLGRTVKAERSRLTEQRRLFLVGDVANDIMRQVAIAAGDGLRAAMTIRQAMERRPDEGSR